MVAGHRPILCLIRLPFLLFLRHYHKTGGNMIECRNDCVLYIDFSELLGYPCQISITPWQLKIHWTNLVDPSPNNSRSDQPEA